MNRFCAGRVGNWRGGLTTPFPVPATSNGACGFPAIRSPARFGARVMRRMPVGPLSGPVLEPPQLFHALPRLPSSPCPIALGSGLADCWVLLSCHPCLPFCQRHCEQQGPFTRRALPRFLATAGLSATVSPSADFPVSRLYGLPCSTDFSMGRGRFLHPLRPLHGCDPSYKASDSCFDGTDSR
jgi:hypothetical protein